MRFPNVPIDKAPYIKGKRFMNDLCQIALYGIPKYADSRFDKKVIGTIAWENFWKEELYKIKNGVTAGGIKIPGRFYYYMNYNYMGTVKGVITPDMVDLHLELAKLLEYCIDTGQNLFIPKGRRRGISEALHRMAIDYPCRFSIFNSNKVSEKYAGAVSAGDKKYVDGFLTKWRFANSLLPPELKMQYLTDNDDEIIFGYEIKSENNAWEERGTFNKILARTAQANSNIFKGEYLNMVVCEEMGEWEDWFDFYADTKDCLFSGEEQVGIMISLGTGGNINKGSKDFKRLSEKAEEYNFIEYLALGTRFYYYGGASDPKRALPADSELKLKYSDYQLIGVEDTKLAEKRILERREKLKKAGDKEEYFKEVQNNPLNKAEIFRKTLANNFNMELLNDQSDRIEAEPKKWSPFVLEWAKDDNGMRKIPLQVTIRPAQPFEDNVVYILNSELGRRRTHKNLYVSGIDSYDQDTSKTSKSLGAMCVFIRMNNITGAAKKVPIACIRTRPKRKEIFYEQCLMLAVHYDIVNNCLIDVRCPGIIGFWKEYGGEKYLANRPAKFESPNSEQGHDYGISLNKYSRPLMVGVMQTHIEDFSSEIWFNTSDDKGPKLISELQDYDEVAVDSDNDLADAYGMALIQDISCEVRPKSMDELNDSDRDAMPEFMFDGNGDIVMKNIEMFNENTPTMKGGVILDEYGDPITPSKNRIQIGGHDSDDF